MTPPSCQSSIWGADGERRALRRHADCSGEEMALARLEGEFRTGFVGHCLAFECKIDDRLARFACLRDYDGRKAGDVVALDSRRAVGTDVGHVGRLAECLGIDIVEVAVLQKSLRSTSASSSSSAVTPSPAVIRICMRLRI